MKPPPTPSSSSSTDETTAGLADILRLRMLYATLPDERVAGRVLHPLPEVLLTALCATVSDCESYTDMESFARSQLDWLRQFIPLRHGQPSHDVFRNHWSVENQCHHLLDVKPGSQAFKTVTQTELYEGLFEPLFDWINQTIFVPLAWLIW